MSLIGPRTNVIVTECPLCTGEITVALHTGTGTVLKRGGTWEVNIHAHTHWGPHACLPLPHNGRRVAYDAAWVTFMGLVRRVVALGENWRSDSALDTAALVRDLSSAGTMLAGWDNPPLWGPVIHAADDLMIGLDGGRTAAEMWADLIDACTELDKAEDRRAGGAS